MKSSSDLCITWWDYIFPPAAIITFIRLSQRVKFFETQTYSRKVIRSLTQISKWTSFIQFGIFGLYSSIEWNGPAHGKVTITLHKTVPWVMGVTWVCGVYDQHTPDNLNFLDVTFYQETTYKLREFWCQQQLPLEINEKENNFTNCKWFSLVVNLVLQLHQQFCTS